MQLRKDAEARMAYFGKRCPSASWTGDRTFTGSRRRRASAAAGLGRSIAFVSLAAIVGGCATNPAQPDTQATYEAHAVRGMQFAGVYVTAAFSQWSQQAGEAEAATKAAPADQANHDFTVESASGSHISVHCVGGADACERQEATWAYAFPLWLEHISPLISRRTNLKLRLTARYGSDDSAGSASSVQASPHSIPLALSFPLSWSGITGQPRIGETLGVFTHELVHLLYDFDMAPTRRPDEVDEEVLAYTAAWFSVALIDRLIGLRHPSFRANDKARSIPWALYREALEADLPDAPATVKGRALGVKLLYATIGEGPVSDEKLEQLRSLTRCLAVDSMDHCRGESTARP